MKVQRMLLLLGLILGACLPSQADSPNLIDNGNFEQLREGLPVGWTSPQNSEIIKTAFPVEEGRGVSAQVELLRTGDKGAYFSKSVKVEPNTRYCLSLLARMNKGKITVAVGGGTGDNKLNIRVLGEPSTRMPMAPLFWEAPWYKNLIFTANQWRPVTIEFDSGDLTQVAVSFGAYFSAGQYSFDDVSLTKIGPSPTSQ